MVQYGAAFVLLWSCILQLSLGDVHMPYYLDKRVEKEVSDDNKQALLKVRTRIAQGLNKTYGIVMVATSIHLDYSVHTIPIWKAYCEKHGYDFFLQEESLSPDWRTSWTKPRLLFELVTKTKWKYIWLVDPSSLPVNFDKGWQYAIKEHMRKQRYKNDHMKERVVWCPEDCDKDSGDALMDGTCHGPLVSGCIFSALHPKQVMPILRKWYDKRKDESSKEERGLKMALGNTKKGTGHAPGTLSYYDRMMWSDVGAEMGREDSSFLRTFTSDEKGRTIQKQVVETLQKYKTLGDILNKHGQHHPEL